MDTVDYSGKINMILRDRETDVPLKKTIQMLLKMKTPSLIFVSGFEGNWQDISPALQF